MNELDAATQQDPLGQRRPSSRPERDTSLQLVDDRDSTLWAGIEATHRDQSVWPALTDALSESGRRLLYEALHAAVECRPGDPEPVLMVVEAFHRTMRIRRGPEYQRRMAQAWDRVESNALGQEAER